MPETLESNFTTRLMKTHGSAHFFPSNLFGAAFALTVCHPARVLGAMVYRPIAPSLGGSRATRPASLIMNMVSQSGD